METSDATGGQVPVTELQDTAAESASRIEIPSIVEQLKKISELKIDDLVQLSGSKFEHTVKEMFSMIKDLEKQLQEMLALNASLRGEVQERKREKEMLLKEKETLEKKLINIENEVPLVQDLEKRLEITIEELEKFRTLYRLEKEKLGKMEAKCGTLTTLLDKTKEERDDAYREIVVMEDKIKSVTRALP